MNLQNLIKTNRSYRRFDEDVPIDQATLKALVDLARLSASAANRQPLKYILSSTPKTNAAIYPSLHWAGYIKDWSGPREGERPAAYIIILGDRAISQQFGCDHGIAAQSILLGAVERGFGGCILGAVQRQLLRTELKIPGQYEILLVIALGKPKEKVVIEPLGSDGDYKYWRDDDDIHHVPKRALEDIILTIGRK